MSPGLLWVPEANAIFSIYYVCGFGRLAGGAGGDGDDHAFL